MRAKFGTVRPVGSGRFQASYPHPAFPNPATRTGRWNAPTTFETEKAARKYLAGVQLDIERGDWVAPSAAKALVDASTSAAPTLRAFSTQWLADRPLKPKTVKQYLMLLNREILPSLGDFPVDQITRQMVRDWHKRAGSTANMKAQAYALLSTIFDSAEKEHDGLIAPGTTPCVIPGAATPPRAAEKDPLEREQVIALYESINERYTAFTAVLGFCGLRFTEAAELLVADINLDTQKLRVRKSKTNAGERTVGIADRIVPILKAHLQGRGGNELAFPSKSGKLMIQSTYQKVMPPAARKAGIEVHVHPHLLRHSAATMYSQQEGVTAADVQRFLGHTTATMALHYMHSNDERQAQLVKNM